MTDSFSRDPFIDILRFIGLSLIILAHVQPSEVIFQLRAFDVPLMLFVSGLTYSGRTPNFSRNFIGRRFKRLLIPVYIFLSCYFLLVFGIQCCGVDFGVRWSHVWGSYCLLDGIGYVWIIRVFLIIALMTPLLLFLENHLKSNMAFLLFFFSILAFNEALIISGWGMNSILIRDFLCYGIAYSMIFMLGLRFRKLSSKTICIAITVTTLCYAVLQSIDYVYYDNPLSINYHKYPPRALFVLYGCAASLVLLVIVKYVLKWVHPSKKLLFIGQNTIWIYLYHIPIIQFTGILNLHWLPRYIITYALATLIVYIQYRLVKDWKININKYLVG